MYRKHVASIAGLRAIAVVSVLLFHVNPSWLPGGFIGVDIFFVISGFVVAHSVAGTAYPSFRSYFVAFYARRFQRILPASYVYIAVLLIATALFIPLAQPTRDFERAGASAVVGLSNVFLFLTSGDYFAESSDLNPFTHTWSLAVEEQYYLVFPFFSYLILVARQRYPRSGTAALVLLAVGVALSLVAAALLTVRAPTFAFYMLPARFWELGLGFFLRYLLDTRYAVMLAGRLGRAGSILGLAGIGGMLVALVLTKETGFPFPGALLPCLSTALVIAMVWCQPGSLADRLLAQRLPVSLGDISYSLYLWHWGVLVLMRWTCGVTTLPLQLLALALSLFLGWLSFRFVEQAFHNKQTRGRAPSARFFLRYAAIAGLVCLACLGVHAVRPQIGLTKANDVAIWDPYAPPPLSADCPVAREQTRLGQGTMSHFVAGCARPRLPRLLVIGDSHAGAYRRLIWRIAAHGKVDPYLLTMGGCRLVSVTHTPPVAGCDAFRAAALAQVRKLAQPGDVIFLSGLHTTRYNDGGIRHIDPQEIAGGRRLLASLASLGLTIVVEGPKPVMPTLLYRCVDRFNALNDICKGAGNGPEDNWKRVAAIRDAFPMLAVGLPGVSIWYPDAILCRDQSCPAFLNGQPLYFDTDHLSAYGNDLLLPSLSDTIYLKLR